MSCNCKVFYHTDGTVVKIPGLPDMYDWEFFPQKVDIVYASLSLGRKADINVLAHNPYTYLRDHKNGPGVCL